MRPAGNLAAVDTCGCEPKATSSAALSAFALRRLGFVAGVYGTVNIRPGIGWSKLGLAFVRNGPSAPRARDGSRGSSLRILEPFTLNPGSSFVAIWYGPTISGDCHVKAADILDMRRSESGTACV
jgi:hypothetical protein